MPDAPDPPPAPEDAISWPEFTGRLRTLYEWCGKPKYRALCGRSPGLSPAAVSNLIGKNPLTQPPETATARFVEACLRYRAWPDVDAEAARWTGHWNSIADGGAAEDVVEGDVTAAEMGDGGSPGRGRWYVVAGGAIVAAAVTAGVVAFVAVPGEGGSGSRCRYLRGTVEDARTKKTWPYLYECPNHPGVNVYEEARFGTSIAVLKTDPSWFVCWTHGERHAGGNDIWYYTQGDEATRRRELDGWGYVPASDLRIGVHPDPVVARQC